MPHRLIDFYATFIARNFTDEVNDLDFYCQIKDFGHKSSQFTFPFETTRHEVVNSKRVQSNYKSVRG